MTFLDEIFNLENKTVVITGAGGHICGALARGFAKANCNVVVTDIRKEKADLVCNTINSDESQNSVPFKLDVESKKDFADCLHFAQKKFGNVDILVNGAGINGPTPFLELGIEEWNAIISSQLTGTMLGCQVFGKHMLENGGGSIINISSASAGPPLSKAFTYSVAKAGILNLTQNLGREWGAKGVRVNAIRPGFFPTEWNKKNFISAEREKAILGHTPMNRYGDPDELIGATLWLASDAASFVTGSEVAIDGGFSCMTI